MLSKRQTITNMN